MRTLQILTAAAGILIAVSGPSLAASRTHRGTDAYASGANVDRSGAYSYGAARGQQGRDAQTPSQAFRSNGSQNLPYPDRPYGAPDRD